jgi:hypothetical protein
MSALPDFLPLDPLEEARWELQEATARLHQARVVRAQAVLDAERAELEHEEALTAWGRIRDGRSGRGT